MAVVRVNKSPSYFFFFEKIDPDDIFIFRNESFIYCFKYYEGNAFQY